MVMVTFFLKITLFLLLIMNLIIFLLENLGNTETHFYIQVHKSL